jgi:excisionase family DNA binding protein
MRVFSFFNSVLTGEQMEELRIFTYSIEEAMKIIGCKRRKIQMLMNKEKSLPFVYIGRSKRIMRDDLIEFLQDRKMDV